MPETVPVSGTPAAASVALMTLLPSTAAMVTVGPVSATVTVWVASGDTLPLASVTCAEHGRGAVRQCGGIGRGNGRMQAVPALLTVAT